MTTKSHKQNIDQLKALREKLDNAKVRFIQAESHMNTMQHEVIEAITEVEKLVLEMTTVGPMVITEVERDTVGGTG